MYKLVTVPRGAKSLKGLQLIDPDLQFIAVNAISRILSRKNFPMFSNVGVKVDQSWSRIREHIDLDSFQMLVLEPGVFEAYFAWDWQKEMRGPIKDYISRGCFYFNEIRLDYTLAGAQVVMRSTLKPIEVEDCIEDAIYFALGVVDERHPQRDFALAVLYNPAVRSGMTRIELFKLVDSGVIPVPE